MLLTLAVVAFSAWRVSVMTISTAIRNLPEPPQREGGRRWILAVLGARRSAPADRLSGAAAMRQRPLMLGDLARS